jgi:hypothetical protein
MLLLILRAYWRLIHFDLYLARKDFFSLRADVRNSPANKSINGSPTTETICEAIDLACIWYWKEVLCLQRAATTACLLKRYGVPARMIIGTQQVPFKAHAWVEVAGRIVNEKPYMHEIYTVLDEC